MVVFDWAPKVGLGDSDQEWTATVELPHVTEDNLNVEIENGTLTILGKRTLPELEEREKLNPHFSYGNFVRTFALPANVEEDRVCVEFENGVLRIRVPKRHKASGAIAVRTSPRSI